MRIYKLNLKVLYGKIQNVKNIFLKTVEEVCSFQKVLFCVRMNYVHIKSHCLFACFELILQVYIHVITEITIAMLYKCNNDQQ